MINPRFKPPLPSNQKFGWFFTGIFCLAAAYVKWVLLSEWAMLLLGLAAVFALLTALVPRALTPLNKLWFQLGLILGRIVSPIVLGIIFYSLITPVAVIARLAGRDELRIKKRLISSFWIERYPPGPHPDSYKNQF